MADSHLHTETVGGVEQTIDAPGTREDCDACRKKAGKPPKSQAKAAVARRVKPGVDPRQSLEDVVQQLEEAEALNDELRDKVKEKDAEIALLKQENDKLKSKQR